MFDSLIGKGADDPFTRYYIACMYALTGDLDRAFDSLRAGRREAPGADRRAHPPRSRRRSAESRSALRGDRRARCTRVLNGRHHRRRRPRRPERGADARPVPAVRASCSTMAARATRPRMRCTAISPATASRRRTSCELARQELATYRHGSAPRRRGVGRRVPGRELSRHPRLGRTAALAQAADRHRRRRQSPRDSRVP